MLIIGLLAYKAVQIYSDKVDDSLQTTVKYQANAFSRTIERLRATHILKKENPIKIDGGVELSFNEFGWPASTISTLSSHSSNQTQEECASLWLNLFSKANSGDFFTVNSVNSFEILLINSHTCRYKLSRKEEESYFFDYDIRTGRVIWIAQGTEH